MRPALFLFSLLVLVGSLVLLVADSMGPCERIEDARADYSYTLTCMEDVASEGIVSFSNDSYSRWFEVEEDEVPSATDPSGSDEVGEESEAGGLEDETYIRFAVARTQIDEADCGPGTGIGILELAVAHATVSWAGHNFVFHCEVYPQADSVLCGPGPEPSPLPEEPEDPPEEPEEPEEPQEGDFPCSLVLTASEPPQP